MNQFLRIFQYAWPHRRKLYYSIIFAFLVAFFWGLNLSMTFLIVKVFLQGQSISQYVDEEIAKEQKEIDVRTAALKNLEQELPPIEAGSTVEDEETVELLKDQSRQQTKLSKASQRLLIFNRVRTYLVPYLPEDQFNTYALIIGVLLGVTILKGLCVFIQEVMIGSVVELTAMDVRKECFRKTLSLDYQTLALNGTSDLMSRFTYDMQLMSHGLRLLGGKVIREPLKAVVCIIIALWFSWQLTLLSLLFAPLAAVVFYRIGRKLKQASRRLMESMSRIYKTLEETLASMKVVIAFNGARRHRQRFHRENKEYFSKALKIVRIDALTSPTTEVMGVFAASLALLPGAYLVLRDTREIWGITLASDRMEIEHLSALYVALAGIIDPARKLSTTFTKLKRGTAAAERIFGLMDQNSLVKETADPKPMPRHRKSIEFHKVNFSYAGHGDEGASRPQVLDDVNLDVKAGEVIVVVGENGSGKSTLVNLLPRYYDPDSGHIHVDGIDIRDVRSRDLRSQISVVTQETLLFDETIYDNIRYGKPNATSEEIEKAARRAHVSGFVEQLPEGFQTLVGEKGSRLSGGQRQRIALARAILRNPTILILDEATSAIDSQSERLIHQALRDFVAGRTTFIITHSVSQSILDFVTRIVVMERGRLVAAGSHDEVFRACPVYQRLFQAQVEQRSVEDSSMESSATRDVGIASGNEADADGNEEPLIIPLRVVHVDGNKTQPENRSSESELDHSTGSRENSESDVAS